MALSVYAFGAFETSQAPSSARGGMPESRSQIDKFEFISPRQGHVEFFDSLDSDSLISPCDLSPGLSSGDAHGTANNLQREGRKNG